MEEMITICGDNCIECPRYLAHSDEELRVVAKLWYKVGWRDSVVSNDEIACKGCSSHKECTYHLVDCTKEHQVNKCNQCKGFPCDKILDMLAKTEEYRKKCREICTDQEYRMLEQAFLRKRKIWKSKNFDERKLADED